MANHWRQAGIPHRGCVLEGVVDVREEGQSEEETDYETCMMCGNEKIRYVHIVTHEEVEGTFSVGCVCAEKMTNDYVNPRKRERELRNRTSRRVNWLKKGWKLSRNGNHYLNTQDHHIVVYKDKKSHKYRVIIDETHGRHTFTSIEKAKIAAFNGIKYFKERGEW